MHFDSIVQNGQYGEQHPDQNIDEEEEPESSYSAQSHPEDSNLNEDNKNVSKQ